MRKHDVFWWNIDVDWNLDRVVLWRNCRCKLYRWEEGDSDE